MSGKRNVLPLLVTGIICLSGCEFFYVLGLPFGHLVPFTPKPSGQGIETFRDVQFEDVPVPISFIMRRDNLFSYKSAAFRLGRFHYDGAWSLNKTWWFYYNQMPKHEWELLSETPGDQMVALVYKKGRERCEITIVSDLEKVSVKIQIETIRDEKPGKSGW